MSVQDRQLPKPLRIAGMILLAGLGAVVGAATARFIDASGLPADDALNLFVAVVMIGMGLVTALVFAGRAHGLPRGCGPLQATAMALAGLMLLAPLLLTRWLPEGTVFGLVIALVVVQCGLNLMLWRRADEMLRRIIVETAALAFWVLQLALFLYAAAERLGLTEGVTAWGMIGIILAVYMVASAIVAARRGVH